MQVNDGIISKLIFNDYSINEIQFEKNKNFQPKMVNMLLDIEKHVDYSEDGSMNVNIDFKVFDKSDEYPFFLKVNMTGFFAIAPSEDKINYEKNAIAIMFPYIRSIVTNITVQANVQPLILPPININKLIDEKQHTNVL